MDDRTMNSNDSWCYPYNYFTIQDIGVGLLSDTSYAQSYVKSITGEANSGLLQLSYESWGSDPLWTDKYYYMTAIF